MTTKPKSFTEQRAEAAKRSPMQEAIFLSSPLVQHQLRKERLEAEAAAEAKRDRSVEQALATKPHHTALAKMRERSPMLGTLYEQQNWHALSLERGEVEEASNVRRLDLAQDDDLPPDAA